MPYMIEKELQNLGLSEKEAKIYLAALELGAASAHDIAKKSGINRATAYFVLKSLMKYGLVSEVAEDKTSKFTAENPGQLEVFLKKKEQEIKESERRFQELLPELRSLYNASEDKPIVRYYDGPEGPRHLRSDILSSKDKDLCILTNADMIVGIFSEEENKIFTQEKKNKKIKTKYLYTSKKSELPSAKGGERKKIDSKDYPMNADIAIYGDTIKISKVYNPKNVGIITIKDKDIASTLKNLYLLAWNNIKK